jgi:putative endonuclease
VLRTFELSDYRQALRLEARIKKLKRPQKELLAAGDETLESELLAGLGETLKERTSRIRKEKAKEKNRKLRTKGARACRYLG